MRITLSAQFSSITRTHADGLVVAPAIHTGAQTHHMENSDAVNGNKRSMSHTGMMSDTNDGYDAVRESYPPILTTAQVAEMLDLNVRTVLNMAGDGRLPASRLAGSRKFHYVRDQIIETLIQNTVDPEIEAEKKRAK